MTDDAGSVPAERHIIMLWIVEISCTYWLYCQTVVEAETKAQAEAKAIEIYRADKKMPGYPDEPTSVTARPIESRVNRISYVHIDTTN